MPDPPPESDPSLQRRRQRRIDRLLTALGSASVLFLIAAFTCQRLMIEWRWGSTVFCVRAYDLTDAQQLKLVRWQEPPRQGLTYSHADWGRFERQTVIMRICDRRLTAELQYEWPPR